MSILHFLCQWIVLAGFWQSEQPDLGDDNHVAIRVVGDRAVADGSVAKTRPEALSTRIVACRSSDRKYRRVILFGACYVLLVVCFELYYFDLDDHASRVCCVLL